MIFFFMPVRPVTKGRQWPGATRVSRCRRVLLLKGVRSVKQGQASRRINGPETVRCCNASCAYLRPLDSGIFLLRSNLLDDAVRRGSAWLDSLFGLYGETSISLHSGSD